MAKVSFKTCLNIEVFGIYKFSVFRLKNNFLTMIFLKIKPQREFLFILILFNFLRYSPFILFLRI